MKTKPFRILAVGDVVGETGCRFLSRRLPELRREFSPDLVIANGENSARGNGISRESLDSLLSAGVDIVTTGNHVFQKREVYDALDAAGNVLRPCNYPGECPGRGHLIRDFSGVRVLAINAQGCVFMEPLSSPFDAVEKILAAEEGKYDLAVCDFHAEATSEKLAFAHVFDGRIGVIFGTHTHVPTADLRVLPKGSGYITDLGMTGARDSILGVAKEAAVARIRLHYSPRSFPEPQGDPAVNGALFEWDPESRRVAALRRIPE